jgi:hypothetical protein
MPALGAPPPGQPTPEDVEAEGERLYGVDHAAIQVHGFVNVEYGDFQRDSATPIPSFDVHNVYLATRASVAPGVNLFAEVEYEHGASIRTDRMFIDWVGLPWLGARVGRFYAPLSYERLHYYAPVRLLSSRPFTAEIAFHEWSDDGVEAYGRIGWLQYEVALVNGPIGLTEAGIAPTDIRDNNRDKATVVRIAATPVAGLELGAAGARGKYDPDGRLAFRFLELDARLRLGRLDLWAEAIRRQGDDEPCAASPGNGCPAAYTGARAGQQGFYLLAAWSVVEGKALVHYLKPALRLDAYQLTSDRSGARRLTAGLSWSPVPHLVFRGEAQWTREFRQAQLRNDGFLLAAVADF